MTTTLRESEPTQDEPGPDQTQKPERTRSKHTNSRGLTIAIGACVVAFFGLVAALALGNSAGGDSKVLLATTTAAAPAKALPFVNSDRGGETDALAAAPLAIAEQADAIAAESPAEETGTEEAVTVPVPAAVEVDDTPTGETPTIAETPYQRSALPVGVVSPPSPPGAPHRHSVSAGGRLFMRGTVPSVEFEGRIVAAVEAVMGPGNAISEFTIDPDFVWDPDIDGPVYVSEKVLFPTGSAEIAEPFLAILGPVPVLLTIQPTATVTIYGHTDSVGNPADNLALSQARVDAVRDWVIAQGGDPDRVIAIGVGDTEPIADNATDEGRALNRRVSFEIGGFEF